MLNKTNPRGIAPHWPSHCSHTQPGASRHTAVVRDCSKAQGHHATLAAGPGLNRVNLVKVPGLKPSSPPCHDGHHVIPAGGGHQCHPEEGSEKSKVDRGRSTPHPPAKTPTRGVKLLVGRLPSPISTAVMSSWRTFSSSRHFDALAVPLEP